MPPGYAPTRSFIPISALNCHCPVILPAAPARPQGVADRVGAAIWWPRNKIAATCVTVSVPS